MSLTLSVHVGRCYTPLWEILGTPLTLTSFHKLKVDQTQPKSAFNLSQTKLRKGNVLTPVCQSVDRDRRCIPPWTHTAWADTPWTHAPAPWTNTPPEMATAVECIILSQGCVILSTRGRGVLCMMSLPIWWTGPMFFWGRSLCLTPCSFLGLSIPGGGEGSSRGGQVPSEGGGGGTHPTGMYSCFKILLQKFIYFVSLLINFCHEHISFIQVVVN